LKLFNRLLDTLNVNTSIETLKLNKYPKRDPDFRSREHY
jgi:hypothetical protein